MSSFKHSYLLGSGLIKPQGEQNPGCTAAPNLFCHETAQAAPDISNTPSSTPELHFCSFNKSSALKTIFPEEHKWCWVPSAIFRAECMAHKSHSISPQWHGAFYIYLPQEQPFGKVLLRLESGFWLRCLWNFCLRFVTCHAHLVTSTQPFLEVKNVHLLQVFW